MILLGWRVLIWPKRIVAEQLASEGHPASWLLAAGLALAIWPAVAVVLGHLGAAFLGLADAEVAIRRAAIGLIAAFGGLVVLAPALTLLVTRVLEAAQSPLPLDRVTVVAAVLLAPIASLGVVLALPPLFGCPPETGEILWLVLAIAASWRAAREGLIPALGIRRRWTSAFLSRLVLAVAVGLVAAPIGPAVGMRLVTGVGADAFVPLPAAHPWPEPPAPEW